MKRNIARFLSRFIPNPEKKESFLMRHMDALHGTVTGDADGNVIENLPQHVNLAVFGSGNVIRFGNVGHFEAFVMIGDEDNPVFNSELIVEDHVTSNGCRIYLFEDGCRVRIGRDTMISDQVSIYASDTHAILSEKGEWLNRGRFVDIGSHVWIGSRVVITKNHSIADGCIIGAGSVVAANCPTKGVYVGNPARLARTGVVWTRDRPQYAKRRAPQPE